MNNTPHSPDRAPPGHQHAMTDAYPPPEDIDIYCATRDCATMRHALPHLPSFEKLFKTLAALETSFTNPAVPVPVHITVDAQTKYAELITALPDHAISAIVSKSDSTTGLTRLKCVITTCGVRVTCAVLRSLSRDRAVDWIMRAREESNNNTNDTNVSAGNRPHTLTPVPAHETANTSMLATDPYSAKTNTELRLDLYRLYAVPIYNAFPTHMRPSLNVVEYALTVPIRTYADLDSIILPRTNKN